MPIDPKGREAPGYDRHVFICGHVVMNVPKAQHGHPVEIEAALSCSRASKLLPEKKDYPTSESRSQDVWTFVKMGLHAWSIQKEHGIG